MPPGSRSRSITTTSLTPRRWSSMAAARPAGPPPTIATSGIGDHPGQLRAAVEALAAAHVPARDPLAETDHAPVVGVGGDQLGALVGAREGLADVRHAQRRQIRAPLRL